MPLSKLRDKQRKRLAKARLELRAFQPEKRVEATKPEIDADGEVVPVYL